MVIQESRPCLHGVGHVDAITSPGEDLAFQHRFDPDVLSLVEGMATIELLGIQLLSNGFTWRVLHQRLTVLVSQQIRHQRRAGQPGLQTAGGEAHHGIKIGIIHLISRQHCSLHQGIVGLQQRLPILAIVLRQVLQTMEEHVTPKRGIATEQLV